MKGNEPHNLFYAATNNIEEAKFLEHSVTQSGVDSRIEKVKGKVVEVESWVWYFIGREWRDGPRNHNRFPNLGSTWRRTTWTQF